MGFAFPTKATNDTWDETQQQLQCGVFLFRLWLGVLYMDRLKGMIVWSGYVRRGPRTHRGTCTDIPIRERTD
eukprot:2382-Eustigmatos_ZCMA.PRE.1